MAGRRIPFLGREIPLRWVIGLLTVLAASAVFIQLAGDVQLGEGFAWDAPLMRALHGASTPWLTAVMWAITQTGGTLLSALVAIGGCWLLWRRLQAGALLPLISWAGAGLMSSLLKVLLARPRPQVFPPLVLCQGYSFPSGHTLTAISLYGLFAVLLWRQHHRLAAILCVVWALLVGLSRVYLGVHYPSDVLASLALGVIWVAVVAFGSPSARCAATPTFPDCRTCRSRRHAAARPE